MTVAAAKAEVEAIRARFPDDGPYTLARAIYNGGGKVGNTYQVFTALGAEKSRFRILNYIRRFDDRQQRVKADAIVAADATMA